MSRDLIWYGPRPNIIAIAIDLTTCGIYKLMSWHEVRSNATRRQVLVFRAYGNRTIAETNVKKGEIKNAT